MIWLPFCGLFIELLEELSLDGSGLLAFDKILTLIQVNLHLSLWVHNNFLSVKIHLTPYFLTLEHHFVRLGITYIILNWSFRLMSFPTLIQRHCLWYFLELAQYLLHFFNIFGKLVVGCGLPIELHITVCLEVTWTLRKDLVFLGFFITCPFYLLFRSLNICLYLMRKVVIADIGNWLMLFVSKRAEFFVDLLLFVLKLFYFF